MNPGPNAAGVSGATSKAASTKFNVGGRFYNAYQVSSNLHNILMVVYWQRSAC
jgi:hypothetical protein